MRKCLCYDVAAGLDAMHLAGIVHGDLNSPHILIFNHPKRRYLAKITSFGRSIIPSSSSQPQIPHGTVPWNALEVEDGKVRQGQLFQTDIFPLGLVLWKIFVHQDLFTSFDLPLDNAARNDDFKQILTMPYLFRFIPLQIEHEVGLIE
jgi:serine/threonine protein kinase